MFGSSILVVPKTYVDPHTLESYVSVDLPQTEDSWFNFNTLREVAQFNGTMVLQYWQQAILVRKGSILPLLNHKRELSLQEALKNPIHLQVYGQEASGFLYLDSNMNDNVATVISFTFASGGLTYETKPAHENGPLLDTSSYLINLITFCGQETDFAKATVLGRAASVESDANGTLRLRNLHIALPLGKRSLVTLN